MNTIITFSRPDTAILPPLLSLNGPTIRPPFKIPNGSVEGIISAGFIALTQPTIKPLAIANSLSQAPLVPAGPDSFTRQHAPEIYRVLSSGVTIDTLTAAPNGGALAQAQANAQISPVDAKPVGSGAPAAAVSPPVQAGSTTQRAANQPQATVPAGPVPSAPQTPAPAPSPAVAAAPKAPPVPLPPPVQAASATFQGPTPRTPTVGVVAGSAG